jgi:hypothetical protein
MATAEQLTMLLQQNAQFMRMLQQQQQQSMAEMVKMVMEGSACPQPERRDGLEERRFRELGACTGSEEEWKQFSFKFKATVKEVSPTTFEALKWAEAEENELTEDGMANQVGEDEYERVTTMVYNTLIHHLKSPALTIHQSVIGENGLEVWRRLAHRYNPMTPMRGLQIMLKVMIPPKIGKGQDVHSMIKRWRGTTRRRCLT